ncbi:hypothetical protein JEQ05_12620 [Serratia liquefaciens]|uniref:hypothetical protein n=1 Tax=Serratia liquefaciens TaxID=614 RepID=UPI0018E4D147|nr:hypothetical protein [Serratia liquefaciens]MBI6162471.1 hypothetical protein [Serratia liquefaciens]
MTKQELSEMVVRVRGFYTDALDGKSVSFTGVNGRTITNHDPAAMRDELEYWEKRLRNASGRGGGYKLANFV